MADTKISALTGATTAAGADEFAINQGGVSFKETLTQVQTYAAPIRNSSVAAQTIAGATQVELVGSKIAVPAGRLQVGSIYRLQFEAVKTAAGTASCLSTLRMGPLGTTSDPSMASITIGSTQTAVVDSGVCNIYITFRAVGASAQVRELNTLKHTLNGAGMDTTGGFQRVMAGTGGTFDSTVANSSITLYLAPGTSGSWTFQLVQAELLNLVA